MTVQSGQNNYFKHEIKDFFQQYKKTIKAMHQDKIFHKQESKNFNKARKNFLINENESYFSIYNEKDLVSFDSPVSYLRDNEKMIEITKLCTGWYVPEIVVDLHGLNKKSAKRKLGEMIYECKKHQIKCANVIHGHGKGILKLYVPIWLSHHPDIQAFHESTKHFGGKAALLVLIKE